MQRMRRAASTSSPTGDARRRPRRACSSTATPSRVFDQLRRHRAGRAGEQGLFHDGTRFLSRSSCCSARRRPLLLSSTVSEDNVLLTVDLTNPDMRATAASRAAARRPALFRARVLWRRRLLRAAARLATYGLQPVDDRRCRCASTPTSPTSSRCAASAPRAARRRLAPVHRRRRRDARLPRASTASSARTRLGFEPAPDRARAAAARVSI